jgi:hypothetical protein
MKTQSDHKVRVVSIENLRAMCERVSGVCHRYWVESVGRSRVKVGYSNPNEYGTESPMFAVFPSYPSGFAGDQDNPCVVLEFLNVLHDNWDGEGWQAFDALRDCPKLWRSPEDSTWSTEDDPQDKKRLLQRLENVNATIGIVLDQVREDDLEEALSGVDDMLTDLQWAESTLEGCT